MRHQVSFGGLRREMLAVLFVVLASMNTIVRASQAAQPSAETSLGKVIGGYTGPNRDVEVYRGIPYAVPPVGIRRWKPAEAGRVWTEPLAADRFGPDCMQSSTMDVVDDPQKEWYYHQPSLTSEDCLYLNVWTPVKRGKINLPVMVWIHGGGLVQGSGSWPLYDGAQLARKGAVIVTVNYRLGIFGGFAHPELTAESLHHASGAYDLSDIIQALKWVQQNISGFGGDHNNVTIFGESAGSLYVNALMASPMAKGLFHRAIGQSGAALYDATTSLATAEAMGVEFAEAIGKPTLAQLRSMTAADLLQLSRQRKYSLYLLVDGYFIPETICKTFLDGRQIDVPVILGFNGDENYGYRPPMPRLATYEEYAEMARSTLEEMGYRIPEVVDGFLSLLPRHEWTPELSKKMISGYRIPGWEMESWAAMMGRVTSNAYLYYFDHVPPGAGGAFHTAEIAYVFNNEYEAPRYSPNMPVLSPRPSDLELADAMSDYWVAFAKTGVPAVEGLPEWKPYAIGKRRSFMEFKDGKPRPADDFFPEIQHKSICEVLK
jgi:para-nitrobenzyl esterase